MTGVSRQLPNFFASFCLASAIEETSAYRAGPAMLEGTTEPLPDALLPFSAPISHDSFRIRRSHFPRLRAPQPLL
jgi:hypothetical protein